MTRRRVGRNCPNSMRVSCQSSWKAARCSSEYWRVCLNNSKRLAVQGKVVIFAEDKLWSGNRNRLHCYRTCVIFTTDKLRLGNRSKFHRFHVRIIFATGEIIQTEDEKIENIRTRT